MKEFPIGLTDTLNEYLSKVFGCADLSEEQRDTVSDSMIAAYAYGVVCGLGMAGAITGTQILKSVPIDDNANPIINTFLKTADMLEADLVEYFKEDMGL